MKKMKLAVMHGVGKELTRDELKNVFGGSCSSIQDAACATLSLDASCSYSTTVLGKTIYTNGHCKYKFCTTELTCAAD